MKKRILGLLLALCLVVSLLPVAALAADPEMKPYWVFQKADGNPMYKSISSTSSPVYLKTVDGRVTETGASATDYNIMLSWPEGGNPTLTLKGAVINNVGMHGINFGRGSAYPTYLTSTLDIVVVSDSSITVDGSVTTQGAIQSYSNGDITIKAENNAKLTLSDGKTGAAAGGIQTVSNLKLENLNLKYTNIAGNCAGVVSAKNTTIEGCTISSQAGGMMVSGDLLIKNSEINMYVKKAGLYVNVTGTVTLEETAVAIGHKTGSGGNKIFSKTPVLVYSNGAEVVRSIAAGDGAPGWNSSDYTFNAPSNKNYVTVDFAAGSTYTEGTTPALNYFAIIPNPPHVHTPAADDGDCTTAVKCTVCGEDAVAAKTHVAGAATGDCTVANKCTNTGCTKDAIAAKSHTGGTATCTAKAVCTDCGKEYGDKLPHTANRTDCSVAANCTVCGEVAYEAGQHSGGTATCKAKAKCEFCNKEYGELAAHTPKADDGDCSTAVKCSVCDAVVTAAKEHKYTNNTDTSCDNAGCTHTRKVETPSTKPDTNNPQTGDEFNMVLWVSLLAVSAVGFAAVLVFGKKRAVK